MTHWIPLARPDIGPDESVNDNISWLAYVIRIKNTCGAKNRDQIIASMAEHNIECGVYFPPIHLQPLFMKRYGYRSGMLPVTEQVASQVIALPFFNKITFVEIKRVAEILVAVVLIRDLPVN